VFARGSAAQEAIGQGAACVVTLPDAFDYLTDGDVVALTWQRPAVRVLYRKNSPNNSFLLTERCNHYCLMCSQPPKDVNDEWIVDEVAEAIPLVSKDTREIGFTGGEPTLLGDRFLVLVQSMKQHLPNTGLHILSNGRRFADPSFARTYAEIGHHDAMVGIPIYSAQSQTHDYVVQADGAYDETLRGILNLKTYGQQVELRVVIHKANYADLPDLAEFVARNLTFVDQVALMGLEMTGFAKANVDTLWIDPAEYQAELYEAATKLEDFGLHVSIYNHQLCTIDRRIWPLARKSISDWKNEYQPECAGCVVADECGGFFATGRLRRSQHIRAIRQDG
jgi:His-Xaa-Ser system radical SAM maturase HxsC